MYKDTKNFVRSCTICLSHKNAFKIPPAPHQPVKQSQEPGETCHIDIFGPLKTTPKGKSYVCSMIDAFTKYIHLVPLPDIKSSTISKASFDNYLVHRSCSHKLVVDNATYFKGFEFLEFCRVMGSQKRHISNYSAHVSGRVEKPNQSLANILASITQNTNDWDEQLPHTMKYGLDKNVGAPRFNVLYDRQGCVLARTVESNQGGRVDDISKSINPSGKRTPCPGSTPIQLPFHSDKYRHHSA
ncbi:integrase catalytic domain-containing protein [Trichonephila clavipes]|nr:integrase catalytic domain-containing protein [Trichonephila clavipes]